MPDPDLSQGLTDVRLSALSRWDDEGGAVAAVACAAQPHVPDMTNAELVLLRVRVIALENLLIAVLAEGSYTQRQMALILSARWLSKWQISSLPEPVLPSIP